MNDEHDPLDDTLKIHQQTIHWLEIECMKYARQFQLARTVAAKEEAKKHLLEVRGRLYIEFRTLAPILGWIGGIDDLS